MNIKGTRIGSILGEIQATMDELSDEKQAEELKRFFKTGPGQYGEGDQFRGIRVPALRMIAGRYRQLPLLAVSELLGSEYHEDRFLALVILVHAYKTGDEKKQRKIFHFYLNLTAQINSWDLVDVSAAPIVGAYAWIHTSEPLFRLAGSNCIWDRRIALVATHYFIKKGEFRNTFDLVEKLINDKEDLIHKAMGWMLREIGKQDREAQERFLCRNLKMLPRTTLRYAIEHFEPAKRLLYMQGIPPV